MKFRSTLLAISTLTFLAACTSTPERGDPPPDRQPAQNSGVFVKPVGLLFASMDTNADMIISAEELTLGTKAQWSKFDRNPSAAYFTEWSQKSLGSTDAFPTFLSFDGDLNGVVTEIEFSDRLRQEFANMDKNKDGQVTRSEMLVTFEAPRGRQRGGEQTGRGGRGGGGDGGRGGRPPR